MSTEVATKWQYLERETNSCYKQLRIKGRGIFARTIYGQYMSEDEPMTVEELAEDFDLPIEAVKEAIAYCESDPPEIREDFAREQALMEATGMNDPNYKWHGRPKRLTAEDLARIYDGTR